ncbi:achaete-scute homolog 3 [Bombina bombina]|uniref:achaete-scute homolog 3 n=1 Tax=Bombina bombina TaxID=8345 RepID=UPI00235AC01E|nr:achaete-scute homolog 3 [Bombina bombina]
MESCIYSCLPEKAPVVTDSHSAVQLSLPFYVDPAVNLHAEASHFSCAQDLTLLSYAPDQPMAMVEHYYQSLYNIPSLSTCPKYGYQESYYGPSYIRKRNERERQRVKCVNEGYAKLRRHLPQEYLEKRLSKVQTLRAAIKYIKHLQDVLSCETTEASRTFQQEHLKQRSSNTYQRY